MSTTTSTQATASPASIKLLNDLYTERFAGTLDASHYQGRTQREVSDMIDQLFATDGTIPPSDESLTELLGLISFVGMQVVIGATQVAVNRQLAWFRAKAASVGFSSFLDSLTADEPEATTDGDAIPF